MIRAYVSERYSGMNVDISIVSHTDYPGDVPVILRVGEGVSFWEALHDGTDATPTFSLSSDAARALLQALIQHYNGADDARALRKDYEHEKQRVDKLIDAVIKG